MQNMPHILHATFAASCCLAHCHKWTTTANIQRTSGKFTLLRHSGVGVWIGTARECAWAWCLLCWRFPAQSVFLYLPHAACRMPQLTSTLKQPRLVSPQKPPMRNSRCQRCCKALAANPQHPQSPPCYRPTAWVVYVRVMFVACSSSYVKHLTPSKWLPPWQCDACIPSFWLEISSISGKIPVMHLINQLTFCKI